MSRFRPLDRPDCTCFPGGEVRGGSEEEPPAGSQARRRAAACLPARLRAGRLPPLARSPFGLHHAVSRPRVPSADPFAHPLSPPPRCAAADNSKALAWALASGWDQLCGSTRLQSSQGIGLTSTGSWEHTADLHGHGNPAAGSASRGLHRRLENSFRRYAYSRGGTLLSTFSQSCN